MPSEPLPLARNRDKNPGRLIAIGFASVIALMAGLALFHRWQLAEVEGALDEVVSVGNVAIQQIYTMQGAARLRSLLLYEIVNTPDAFELDEKIQRFYEHAETFGNARRTLLALKPDPDRSELLEQQREATARTMLLQQAVIDLSQEGRRAEAERMLSEHAIPAQEAVTQALRALLAHEVEMIRKHSELSSRKLHQLGQIIWAVTGVVVLLSGLIGAFISHRLSALIGRLRNTSEDLKAAVRDLEYQKFALDQHAIVSIADAGGAITYVNDKFCEISCYARAELLGQNHRLLRSGVHALEFYEQMWATIMGGQVWRGDICNRNKDGGLYWVATTIVPFMDDAELPYQYVSIRTDITHVKAAEENLLRNASQLEQKVADRTAALALANRELEIEVRQRRELEEHLKTLASTDTLTEIFNRRKFDAVLAAELDRAVRYGQTFSLILFDIDHFKQVNDRFGHPAGDGVLSVLAKVVTSATRASDVFARWGGEEFVVLAPNNAGEQSRLLAEKLRAIVACQEFPVVGHVTCSFGVTSYAQGDDADTLLRRVDEALYRAKLGGRNRVEVV